MAGFSARRLVLVASWVATTWLLYGTIFGFQTLAQDELEIQLHNTYLAFPPSYALVSVGLLLVPLTGAVYLLFQPQPSKLTAWVTIVGTLLLLYACGGIIEALAPLRPMPLIWISGSDLTNMVPAESPLLRLLPVLRVVPLLLGAVLVLAGYALGRRRQLTKTPGSQD